MTIVHTFATLEQGVAELRGRVRAQEEQVEALRAVVAAADSEIAVLTLTSATLESLLRAVSLDSLATLESLVTYGLRAVFDDLALGFTLPVSTKRGVPWVEPRLQLGALDAPILEAFGGGPASLVSFLLRLMVCRRAGLAPVILCDETFSMVSAEYLESVGELLRELAKRFGLTILLVTHQAVLAQAADHWFEIADGPEGATFVRKE
jgi:DNA repair ATPase RecN